MNAGQLRPPPQWSAVRWVVLVTLVAAVQMAVFFRFSRWPRLPQPTLPDGTEVTLYFSPDKLDAPRTRELTWETEPRQFALPDRHGFSGLAARALPPPEYELARWTAIPQWLPVAAEPSRVGSVPPPVVIPPGPRVLPTPQTTASTPTPLVLAGQSRTSLTGNLANREFRSFSPLPAASGSEVLAPTILDLAVSPGGAVMLTRLASSSGNRDLDLRAVEWARALRFEAIEFESSPAAGDPTRWMDGQLVFHWRVEPEIR